MTNQPKQCPTCGSVNPAYARANDQHRLCIDPWHSGLATPAAEEPFVIEPKYQGVKTAKSSSSEVVKYEPQYEPADPQPEPIPHAPWCYGKHSEDGLCVPATQPEPTAEHDPVVNVIGLEFRIKQLNHYLEIKFVNQAYYDDMLTRAIKGAVATERRLAVEAFAEKLKGEAETMYLPANEYGDRESVDGVKLEHIDAALESFDES